MKNPYLITIEDGKHVEVGDPFILRFNGKYYLYCSTCDEVDGIRCFISDDLINFNYYGLVAKNELLKHAYAPEVIYYNGEFIMATSPRGNGHYFLKASCPLGPFEFISDNLANMIDGSFVIDKFNKLHFLRADHNGIAYLDYIDGKLVNRKDILPQIGNAWTEGPSITYFKNYYYATYCGNDVLSSSYRVYIASSKEIDSFYHVQDKPLLLSTEEGFSGLGHNSVVLGPSLDEYYVAYHKLDWVDENHTTRYLCLDRLYFNKRDCACNHSNFSVPNPKRPDFECDLSVCNLFDSIKNMVLTPIESKDKYTAEFNVMGDTNIILGYLDDLNYYLIHLNDNNICITHIKNGISKDIINKTIKFSFIHFHSLRIINDDKCEVLIDNVPLFKIKKLGCGKCGYVYKDNGLFYTALTNSVYTNSMKDLPFVIPGKIESNYTNGGILHNNKEIDSILLKKNNSISYPIICKKEGKYKIFARMKNDNCTLLINGINSIINKNECEYEYSLRYLGEVYLKEVDEINVYVTSGNIEYQYLIVEVINDNYDFNFERLKANEEAYCFSKYSPILELEFRLSKKPAENLFGLIVNSKDYSNWYSNKRLAYMGYFVGFDNNLLVIDYCRYDRTRIYDKPYRLIPNKKYRLKVITDDNMIYVYINDKLEIKTCLKYDHGHGACGVYKCKNSKVSLINYKDGDLNEI